MQFRQHQLFSEKLKKLGIIFNKFVILIVQNMEKVY